MIEQATLSTPADVLKYQSDLVRTGQYLPLGRMKMIAIAPNKDCPPLPTWDPIMQKWGRLMQLREMVLPIGQSLDRSMILVCAPLCDRNGRVGLPDLADPNWKPSAFTKEEIEGVEKTDAHGKKYCDAVPRSKEKDAPRNIPQDLRARAEGFLDGSNFYVFSPVLSISFQPEVNHEMLGTFWAIDCRYNPADRTHPSLLIDAKTGETHFFGGLYDVVKATGE
jgi:hypothetical protein